MHTGRMKCVMFAVLVLAPAATFAAESRKPKEIVVVGAKIKDQGKQKGAKAGRRIIDCEGYAYMTRNVLGASCR